MIYDSDVVWGAGDLSVNVDLGSGDDFWVSRDAVFVNDLLFWRSPRVLKISASAVDVGSDDYF